jgi:serine/threonine protein kinase
MNLSVFMRNSFSTSLAEVFPIPYVKLLATQMLRALEFIHSAQVIHSGLTTSVNTLGRSIHLQTRNILLRIDDETVLKDASGFSHSYLHAPIIYTLIL